MQSPYLYFSIVLGVIAVGFGVRSFIRRRERWVKTKAWIEKCEAATLITANLHVPGVRLFYSFEVEGRRLDNQVAEFCLVDETNIQPLLEWFHPQTQIVVRYDRKNPESSMIDPLDNPKLAYLAGMAYGEYGGVNDVSVGL